MTEFTLSFESPFLIQAVDLLSELVVNPLYDSVQVEALKGTIYKNATSMDPYTVTTESVHYTAFRVYVLSLRIISLDNPPMASEKSSTPSLQNKSKSIITTSMSEKTSSSVEQATSISKH